MKKPSNRQAEMVSISGTVSARTAKALLVDTDRGERWIPLSQVHKIDAETRTIYITPFIAKSLGL